MTVVRFCLELNRVLIVGKVENKSDCWYNRKDIADFRARDAALTQADEVTESLLGLRKSPAVSMKVLSVDKKKEKEESTAEAVAAEELDDESDSAWQGTFTSCEIIGSFCQTEVLETNIRLDLAVDDDRKESKGSVQNATTSKSDTSRVVSMISAGALLQRILYIFLLWLFCRPQQWCRKI